MLSIAPLPGHCPIDQQLSVSETSVVLINFLTAPDSQQDLLLKAWADDARWMGAQTGFVSTQLHRALGSQGVFMNLATWATTEDFRAAFTHPEFRESLARYPAGSRANPQLFKRFAVPGICGS
ncbi:MAG: antibiotic biosynthesis monooxygenase family protein [Wenzhouxiangella sp.]